MTALGAVGTVIQVGDGPGFVIATDYTRYVVTAAHCLGKLPEAYSAREYFEATQQDFLGPLGGPREVWAECLFIDPIADIAVFGTPETQELYQQAEAYEALTEQATPFRIGKLDFSRRRKGSRKASFTVDGERRSVPLPTRQGPREAVSDARMLSLDGEWFKCRVTSRGRSLLVEEAARPIFGGMSGSPIILPDGAAGGIVCVSAEGAEGAIYPAGPNPMLTANLPAWLVEEAAASSPARGG